MQFQEMPNSGMGSPEESQIMIKEDIPIEQIQV
jgi:hypothetical protein